MKSSSQTTYILLERGSEDRALWEELHKVVVRLKISSVRDFITEFPMLHELKHNLKRELDDQEAG